MSVRLQDYLGAIIVFIAVLTALISSYLLPDETSASLVALALQYSLLIPIYLNWVVKLYADMEMYFGACERISYYIENCYHEQQNSMDSCKYTILRFRLQRHKYLRTMEAFVEYNVLHLFMFTVDEPLPASWPQYGTIEFRNVSLKHPTQDKSFITDFNLIIPTGQRVSKHVTENSNSLKIYHRNLSY